MNVNQFDDIRPFNEEEGLVAIRHLFTDKSFIDRLQLLKLDRDIDDLCKEVLTFKSITEFQIGFSKIIFDHFVNSTTTQKRCLGIDNIDKEHPQVFIGNHRDIVLDSTFLQTIRFAQGLDATRSAIGNNLVKESIFVVLARLNKMFLIYRDDKDKAELLKHTKQLSDYIVYTLFEEKESIWIAQRSGRAKDGIDKTQQGLLKMLVRSLKDSPVEALKKLRISTSTISYQYEPCDHYKARELALSEMGKYEKKPGEDLQSIIQGFTAFKGEMTLYIGHTLNHEFDAIDTNLSVNDQFAQARNIVDTQIYDNYYLYNTNYIAYDIAENTSRFSLFYTSEEKENFIAYLNKQAECEEVPKEKMMHYLLKIYSNPVRMKKL